MACTQALSYTFSSSHDPFSPESQQRHPSRLSEERGLEPPLCDADDMMALVGCPATMSLGSDFGLLDVNLGLPDVDDGQSFIGGFLVSDMRAVPPPHPIHGPLLFEGDPEWSEMFGSPMLLQSPSPPRNDNSISPISGPPICTPASTLSDSPGDATVAEESSASDNILMASPSNATSPSSDDAVDGHGSRARATGLRQMSTSQPRRRFASGVVQLPTYHATTSIDPLPASLHSPGMSRASTSGWPDPTTGVGEWGQLQSPMLYSFADAQPTASAPHVPPEYTQSEGPSSRSHDYAFNVRTVNNDSHMLGANIHGHPAQSAPYGAPQTFVTTTTTTCFPYTAQQHAYLPSAPLFIAQPFAQPFAQPVYARPVLPSQHIEHMPSTQSHPGMMSSLQSEQLTVPSTLPLTVSTGLMSNPNQPAPNMLSHVHSPSVRIRQHPPQQQQRNPGRSPVYGPPPPPTHRQLQPVPTVAAVAGPSATTQAPRKGKGGRQRGQRLEQQKRERSHKMRDVGSCWHCVMQRDPCPGDGTPCDRCIKKAEKGQLLFFPCDRSRLPSFVHDFMPPSMTEIHQKQKIEDYVKENVLRFYEDNCLNIELTSGYGPPLTWKLYEFQPHENGEPLWQLQYRHDATTGRWVAESKWSPPFGLLKIETSDDTHFDKYLERLMHPSHLSEFGEIYYAGESQAVDDFQERLLQALCDLYVKNEDVDLHSLLSKIIRLMIVTYIMSRTLTISEDTVQDVLSQIDRPESLPNSDNFPSMYVSPRLANRQFKFFFCITRNKICEDVLNWQHQTLHTSVPLETTWLGAFCVMLVIAMALEEYQQLLWLQADARVRRGEKNEQDADIEAFNACQRIDERFQFLVGLFQRKYRSKKWTNFGSFGPQTPILTDNPAGMEFAETVYTLLLEKQLHLQSRRGVPLASETQELLTSRLVARFLLPFLNLPLGAG